MSDAEDTVEAGELAEDSNEPQPCMPCHGSGQLISNLGGTPSKVTCPWCQGGGMRLADADAQEYRRQQDG